MQKILQKQGMIGGKQMRFRCRKTPCEISIFVQNCFMENLDYKETKVQYINTQTSSNSFYFKIPFSINIPSIIKLSLYRFQTSDQIYQLHLTQGFEDFFRIGILNTYYNSFGIALSYYEILRQFIINDIENSIHRSYAAWSSLPLSATNNNSGYVFCNFQKETDGISATIENWRPKGKVYNNDETINDTYSNMTFNWWSQFSIYYYN